MILVPLTIIPCCWGGSTDTSESLTQGQSPTPAILPVTSRVRFPRPHPSTGDRRSLVSHYPHWRQFLLWKHCCILALFFLKLHILTTIWFLDRCLYFAKNTLCILGKPAPHSNRPEVWIRYHPINLSKYSHSLNNWNQESLGPSQFRIFCESVCEVWPHTQQLMQNVQDIQNPHQSEISPQPWYKSCSTAQNPRL